MMSLFEPHPSNASLGIAETQPIPWSNVCEQAYPPTVMSNYQTAMRHITEGIIEEVLHSKVSDSEMTNLIIEKAVARKGGALLALYHENRFNLLKAEIASVFARMIGMRRAQVNQTLHKSKDTADMCDKRSQIRDLMFRSLLQQPTRQRLILSNFFWRFYIDISCNDTFFAQTIVNSFLATRPPQLIEMIDTPELSATAICMKLAELQASAAMIAYKFHANSPERPYGLFGNFQCFTVKDVHTLIPHVSPRDPSFSGALRIRLVNDAATLMELLGQIRRYARQYEEKDKTGGDGLAGDTSVVGGDAKSWNPIAVSQGWQGRNGLENSGNHSDRLHDRSDDREETRPNRRGGMVGSIGLSNLHQQQKQRNRGGVTPCRFVSDMTTEPVIGVDLEGMALSRFGPLCLVQLCLGEDPSTVFVVDVHVLGRLAFDLCTPDGWSLRSVFASPKIVKVWFDPRNDTDALYHQFGVTVDRCFCLQLAEVAYRRSRNISVHFVLSLPKTLSIYHIHSQEQKVFAEAIENTAKSIYRPESGGHYAAFQARPLHPSLLIYAAHDAHDLLALFGFMLSQLEWDWMVAVADQSAIRAEWWKREHQDTAGDATAPIFSPAAATPTGAGAASSNCKNCRLSPSSCACNKPALQLKAEAVK